jgi:hypothetical protein
MKLLVVEPMIAIITENKYSEPKNNWKDDVDLLQELIKIGCKAQIVSWRTGTAWDQYDAIFVSSSWDIPAYPVEFLEWLETCSKDKARLINDKDVIVDNIIKSRYLSYLIQEIGDDIRSGHAITPSKFFSRQPDINNATIGIGNGSLDVIIDLIDQDPIWQGKSIVFKPVISADGAHTYIFHRGNGGINNVSSQDYLLSYEAAKEKVDALLDRVELGGLIVQPYISGVEDGEYSLVFFDGVYSHAIRKPNGFRQADHQSRVPLQREDLPAGMLDFCNQLLQTMIRKYGENTLTRVRIDLFQNEGRFVLCEMECTEPNTNLQRFSPIEQKQIISQYAKAIKSRACQLTGLP